MTATICSNGTFSVTPANGTNGLIPTGTTYSWSVPTMTSGLSGGASETNKAAISGTLINSSNTAQTATYTVTPKSGGCTGANFTVTVTVNPKPVMTSPNSAIICSGEKLNIPLTADPSSSFRWVATNNVNITGESTNTQFSSTINNTLTNTSSVVQTVNYTVIPTATSGGCTGNAQTVTITVNALPILYSVTGGGSYCIGSGGLPIGLSGSQAGVNYQLYRGAVITSYSIHYTKLYEASSAACRNPCDPPGRRRPPPAQT